MLSKKLNPKKSKAQAMVEFAIALPVLLALLYGILETGRLVFLYSTIVNASRQAVRYAATTGTGNGTGSATEKRYEDCDGIRKVAKDLAYISSFSDSNITIDYDSGPNTPINTKSPGSIFCAAGALTDNTIDPSANNDSRITVTVSKLFTPIIPKLVPFAIRTIKASSSRTIIVGVNIATPVPVQVATVTTITLDTPDPSDTGQSVSVTVTVTGGTTPTGTVDITGADTNCTITLNSSGTGSCNVIFNSGGAKVITATYNGDTTHVTSSDDETHNVKYTTVTTITSISPEPSTSGQAVLVSFTVSSSGLPTPAGTVSVTGANTTCNNITLNSSGMGSCSVTFTSATTVTKTLTATYTPAVADTTHMASSGTADHDVILNLDTITRITSISPEPSVIGQAVTVSVKVVGLTTPTGTVNITGADTNCTITLSNGVGSCSTVNFNSAGNKTLTATYVPAPAGSHNASSTTKAHAVNLQPTVTTIAADTPDPSEIGGTVGVTVTVTGGTATPTGTVTISGADSNCVITLTNGSGTCNVVFSSGGGKTLSATYSGDATHTVSNGTAPHTVNSISATPVASCNAITHGAITAVNNTLTMTVTNPYGFPLKTGAGTVTWNNDKGHQTGGDKTLSLQSISINGTIVWSGSSSNVSTIPFVTPADIPAGPITFTITLTFDKTYDNFNGFENIFVNLVTPGCESNPITSG